MSVFMKSIAHVIAAKTKDRFASIHIDAIGLIRLGQTNAKRLNHFDQIISSAEQMGGNIMIPTFSYTYAKNQVFDILETPSDVGLVTEFLRERYPYKRTIDPFFSYLVFGEKGSAHFKIGDYECFGEKSLIGDLFTQDGYICSVGDVFHNTPTEVHYIEKLLNVHYRFNKVFNGIIKDYEGKHHQQKTTFYCRKYLHEIFPDMTRLESDLKKSNLFEYWHVDHMDFEIQAISFHRLYDFVKDKLARDPGYLCSTPSEYEDNLKKRLQNYIR
jgi:aminoglycoside N3'-acetyltransferase